MKVSARIITYNQKKYIAQALDGALMQQTSFEFEIVVGEDCSTDRTRDVVVEYAKRYPDKIRPVLQPRNLRRMNGVRTLQACRGQYVAMLEGDDFWTSPHKLQRQVDFLDSHPECAMCFHNARRVDGEGKGLGQHCGADQKEISTLEDILARNFMPTCSVMFRSGLFGEFPDWYFSLPFGDWPLHILNAQHGKIGYLDEVMGARRIHSNGVHGGLGPIQKIQKSIAFCESMNVHLNYRYERIFKAAISRLYYDLAREYENRGDVGEARACAKKCVTLCPLDSQRPTGALAKMLLRLYVPKPYKLISTLSRPMLRRIHPTVASVAEEPADM